MILNKQKKTMRTLPFVLTNCFHKKVMLTLACCFSRYCHTFGLALLALLVGLPGVSLANTSTTPMKFEYVFTIGGESGFTCIQDRDGFLWFSSFFQGMVRFDGTSKWMISEGPEGISNDLVTQLFEDKDGNIWAGTYYGVNRYDKRTNTVTKFLKDPAHPNTSLVGNVFNVTSRTIIQDQQGFLWFGTQDGLSRFNPADDTFTNYQHVVKDPNSLSGNDIFSVFEDSDGAIWVGTRNHGLNRFDRRTGSFTRFIHDPEDPESLPGNSIQSIVQDRDGHLWLATREHGLIRRDRVSGAFTQFKHEPADPDSLPLMDIRNLVFLPSGEIALTSDTSAVGLILFDPRTGNHRQHRKKPGDPYSLASDIVKVVFEDRDGTLWIVQNNGKVYKADPRAHRFTSYQHNPIDERSLGGNTPVTTYQDRSGNIWIGLFGDGLNRYNPETDDFDHFKADPSNPRALPHGYPSGFFETHRGDFIISTGGGMVYFDNIKKEVIERITDDTWIYTIIADHEDPDVIWGVGAYQGLVRFNLRTRERKSFLPDPQNPDSILATIALRFIRDRDDPNIFWIATWGGRIGKVRSSHECLYPPSAQSE